MLIITKTAKLAEREAQPDELLYVNSKRGIHYDAEKFERGIPYDAEKFEWLDVTYR